MTFFSTGERYVRHRGGEGSPPMNAPFLTDEERERYRGSDLLYPERDREGILNRDSLSFLHSRFPFRHVSHYTDGFCIQ